MKCILLHLDLGIGGAEKLVVNLACGLQNDGHEVQLLTTHHDENHCFDETSRSKSGCLGNYVHVYGDWLPRHLFAGRFTAACAILRMMYLSIVAICIFWFYSIDIIILDGVSAPLPLLKLGGGIPVLFYCHFPDKLLCTERASWLKRFYRFFVDIVEEISTACADKVVVNSNFTADTFVNTFSRLFFSRPEILYPPVLIEEDDEGGGGAVVVKSNNLLEYLHENGDDSNTILFVSLNRYERKKDIGLAISAFAELKSKSKHNKGKEKGINLKLVVAGGYDSSVSENIEYLKELESQCDSLGLIHNTKGGSRKDVIFRCSISNDERVALLRRSAALLYTPSNEHFGIVPLEAMLARTPVIAVNSGGPLETVVHGTTGYLCPPTPAAFSNAMSHFVTSSSSSESSESSEISTMGDKGRQHVIDNFTIKAMTKNLVGYLKQAQTTSSKRSYNVLFFVVIPTILSCFYFFYAKDYFLAPGYGF